MELSQLNQDIAALREIAARLSRSEQELSLQDQQSLAAALSAIEGRLEPQVNREEIFAENRRQKALLDGIFEADPGGLAVVAGDDLRFVSVNATYRFLIPDPFLDPIGQKYAEIWPAASGEHFQNEIWRALKTGQPFLTTGFELPLSIGITRTFTFQVRRIDWVGEPAVLIILWDTTELEKSNRALLESRQRIAAEQEWFRTTLASIGDAVITTDARGAVTFLNPIAEQLTRWTSLEAAGRPVEQVFPIINEQTQKPARNPVGKVLRKGAIVGLANHTALIARDGRRIPIEDSAAPIRDQAGKILGVVMVFHDVSEKRKAEAALRESEARFMAIFQHAPIGIALSEFANGKVIEVNDAFEQMFGYKKAEIIGRTSAELSIAPDPAAREQFLAQIKEQGFAHQVELTYRDRSGEAVALWGNIDLIAIGGEKYILSTFENITVRKQAEENIQRSQQKTREVLESIQDGFMELDRSWRFTYVNRRAAENIGHQLEDLIGQNIWETFPGLRGTAQELFYRRTMEQRQPTQIEVEGVLTQRWYDLHAYPSEEGITVFWTDITERKQAEEKLRQDEITLRSILNATKESIWLFDSDGTILMANETALSRLNKPSAEVIGRNYAEFMPDELAQARKLHLREVVESGQPTEFQDQRAGIYFLHNFYPIIDPVRGTVEIISYSRNITEAKRTEEALYNQAALLDQINDAIVASDQNYRITSWNNAAERMYGWKAEEVLGRTGLEIIQTVFPEKEKASMLDAIAKSGYWRGEATQVRKDGTRIPVEVSSIVLKDQSGQISGYVSVNREISERKQAEQAIQHRDRLMEAINRVLEELLRAKNAQEFGRTCLPIVEKLTGSQISFIGEMGANGKLQDIAISDPGWAMCAQSDQSGHHRPPGNFEIHGLYGRVLTDGKSLIANEPATHPDCIGLPEGHPPLKSFLGVPLILDGKTIGILAVGNRENGYNQVEQEDLETLAPVIVEALMRARAEQALQESEALYRAIGESIDYGVWVCEPDGRNIYASDSYLKLVGLSQEQCSSFGWGDVLHPDDAERTIAAWKECVRSGGTWDIEHRFRGVDGQWHPILARGVPVRDAEGQLIAWAGINLDISRLKKAEEDLREALERVAWLARFPEENPNPVARLTVDGCVLYRNRPAAEMPGWQLVVGEPLPSPLLQIVEQALAHDGEFQEDVWLGEMSYSVSVVPCLDEGYLNIYGRNVTVRKQIEKALLESEEKYRTTLSSIGDGVITTDLHGSVTFLNPVAERLTGWIQSEAAGQPLEQIMRMVNEQSGQPAQNPVDFVLSEGKIFNLANHTALIARDGRVVPIEDSAAPICDQAGIIVGVVIVFHDVSEKRKAELALHESQALLQAVLESTPDPIFLKDRNSRILLANPATIKVVGKPAEQILGKNDAEFYDDPAVGRAILENDWRVMETGQTEVIEERVGTPTGERIYLSTKAPFRDAVGNVVGVVGLAHDITERKAREKELERLNRTLLALSNSSQAMLRAEDEATYMEEVCRIIREDCGHVLVWIGMAEEGEDKRVRPVAWAGFEDGYLEMLQITWADTERGRGPTGTAIRTGQPSMCRNMLTDPAFRPWREQAVKRGYASSLVLPLLAAGKAFGALTVYSREPDPFSEDEVRLLSELANDLAYGINSIRLRAARNQAEAALRENEKHYRTLFLGMTEGFALHEILCDEAGKPHDYRFLDINPAFEQMTGLKHDDVIGRTIREVMPDVEDYWIETYGRVALTGEPAHFQNYSAPLGKYFEVVAFSPQHGQFAVLFIDTSERVRTEAENRKMASDLEIKHRLIEQRELERIQIARDLHDGPVQELIAVTYILHGLMMDPLDPQVLKELEEVKTSIHNQVTELRNYAMELRPPVLSRMGLESAIRLHLENFRAKHPELAVQFETDAEIIVLPEETRVALFRIYQEGLNNIAKHAHAKQVTIRFTRSGPAEAILELRDDGVGFEVPGDWLSLARKGHLGLVGMQERVEAIGGRLECESAPGAGAAIRVVVS